MKNHENPKSTSNTFFLPGIAALLSERRLCPFRYAVGLVALFSPLVQGCGDNATCAQTATCSPWDMGNGGSVTDVTPDTRSDGGAVGDSNTEAGPDLIDGGSFAGDSARDDRSTSDGAGDGNNDGATRSDSRAETDAGGDNDGTLQDAGTADRSDPVPTTDAADVADAPSRDTLVDAIVDAPIDIPPDVPVCDASPGRSPLDEPCLVNEAYGVFVAPAGSDITGNGTRAAPFKTIGRGMGASKRGPRVFVCDDGSGYRDPIVADRSTDGLGVYGGFDCATWVSSANARTRVLPKDGPAITVSGLTVGITIENFDLRTWDATAGASSIAAIIDTSVGVVFRRSLIVAGKGGAGSDGRDGTAGGNGSSVGVDQSGHAPFCPASLVAMPGEIPNTQPGGVPVDSSCGATGGNGGVGSITLLDPRSNPGENGQPTSGVSPANRANAGITCWSDTATPGVTDGSRGADGISGVPGASAPNGGIFSATGYSPPAPGGDGTAGRPAQGGGGGVGCPASRLCLGPSGGAGGAGGCGGQYGTGGGPGGASIGLLSWRSSVVLDKCEIISANGGTGGRGGHGGAGGKGAAGGKGNVGYDGSDPSGAGGLGGDGGSGAAGAGGNGGPTYGIVFAGQRPTQVSATTVTRGSGGPGGAGGTTPASPISVSSRAADGALGDASYELALP
jgi:hypothetical protein